MMFPPPQFPSEGCHEVGNDSKSATMQEGCKEGADTAEGGQFLHFQPGSEGGDGGEPTHEMGQTEEHKQ